MIELGKIIASVLQKNDLIYLNGELGAGKTTIARGIIKGLGYQGRVNSPTFTLMNEYETEPRVVHFDFYRLESDELIDLGLEEYLEKDAIAIIEWPEIGKGKIPDEAIKIDISLIAGDYELGRIVEINSEGQRYLKQVEELSNLVDISAR